MDFIKISTTIDYEGQKKAERCFQIVVCVFGVIGFIWGYLAQSFAYTLICTAVGVGLSCLAVLPPWPCWNRHQLKWQKAAAPSETVSTEPATKGTKSEASVPAKKSDNKKSK